MKKRGPYKRRIYMPLPLDSSEEELEERQKHLGKRGPRGGMVVWVDGQECVKIPLGNNKFCLIDKEDYEHVGRFRWSVSNSRHGDQKKEYVCRHECVNWKTRVIYLHRQVMGFPDVKFDIDHIFHNQFDNRKSKLRLATRSQNIMNSKSYVNEYKGVSPSGRPNYPWMAGIKKDRIRYGLGRFKTKIEAAYAYDVAAMALFGEFACLNFPTPPEEPMASQLPPF